MPLTDVAGKARALYEARRTRQPIEPFTDADPDLGMADGYAVQQQLTALLLADGDRIIGYKVGLTSAPMQKMIGVDSPDYGPVLESTLYRDGDTVTVTQARAALAGAVAGLEIVDSRIEDWRIGLADTVADLASNGAAAVSGRI